MKKTIYSRYDKERIKQLPRIMFTGRIVMILTPGEAERAVDYLLTKPVLGIDTETKPSFRRGEFNKVSLLQVSTEDTCFLFRLNRMGFAPAIKRLMEDKNVLKVGLSLHDDFNSLHRIGDFEPGLFYEIQDHVREIGVEDLSLQKLYANLFGQKISKTQQLSNWEADVLRTGQKLYAALDAWACIQLYEELKRLEQTGDYELIKVDNEQKEDYT